jgi:LPXTG-site transpeptidase (sortase) family protein
MVVVLVVEAHFYQLLGRWQLGMMDPVAEIPELPAVLDELPLGLDSAEEGVQPRVGELLQEFLAVVDTPRVEEIEEPVRTAEQIEEPPPAPGTPLGTISIPEVGVDAVILEGVDDRVLRRGVGHFPHSSMPGAGGNFALAAHRDSFFRGLRHIQEGQRVVSTTADGNQRAYRVASTEVVKPSQVEVLDDVGHEVVTLITCYPFNYVGPAPRRFVVQAYPESG